MKLDPFAARLKFAARLADPRIKTVSERPGPREVARIDAGVEERMDLDEVERLRRWTGALKEARPMSPDGLPAVVEEAMREKERQFILRNLARVERFVDPDEPLPFSVESVDHPTLSDAYARTRAYKHEAPRLLDEMNLDVVRAELAWRRRMTREIHWGERFGEEVRRDLTGPLWKYNPDAPAPEDREAPAAAEVRATGDAATGGEQG